MDLKKLKNLTQEPKKEPAKTGPIKENALIVRNSYCSLSGFSEEVLGAVEEVLTYQNDIEPEKQNIFRLMKMAKAKGNKKQYYTLVGQLKKLEGEEFVCWLEGEDFPTGHLNIVKDVLDALGQKYTVEDQRKRPEPYVLFRWKNKPYEPRYYQKEMIDLGIKHGRGVFEASVGAGKTLVMEYLIYEFGVNTLIVAPSRALLEQIKLELEIHFGQSKVQHVESRHLKKENPTFPPIRIATIQTLASLQKNGLLQKLIKDIDAIFIDEFHHSGSASFTNLLKELEHIYFRFGQTGTFCRNDNKTLDMWGVLSTKLYSYPAWKAIEEGYLTPIKALIHTLQGQKNRRYQKEYKLNYCREKEDGGEELLSRIKFIVEDMAKEDDQILILVSRKDTAGKIIHKYLNANNIENTYISGDDSKEDIYQSIKKFNEKKIRILIGSSVIGEGIDVRSTDHLIMAQGGKSEIAITQAVGRAVRLFEGKDIAFVHDFRFLDTKYMIRHISNRLDIYKNNFAADIIEVD